MPTIKRKYTYVKEGAPTVEKTLKEIFAEGIHFDENILTAFEKGKLIFFIGAGVSRIMGVPGWDDFSSKLICKAFPEYKVKSSILRDITNCKEKITIAYKEFEQQGKLNEFYFEFGKAMKPDSKVFKSKENIYEILNHFDALFLTTNADNLFEDVLGSPLCHEDCEIGVLKSEHLKRQNHLFYLHGHYKEDINFYNNNLVFTAPQYVARYNDEKFVEFLRAVFREDNTIIFVGYGLNEFELIDYIVTKTGYNQKSPRSVYVLYGFCDNDDILYKAKKAYFDSLNIEMLPYDIGKRGYDSLIDVLNVLYKEYRKKAIVPVTDTITTCISELNDENYATIARYLKIEDLAHTNEVQITREIIKSGNFEWVSRFYSSGLFSSEQLDRKIEYRAWPLLEALAAWVKSDDETAQIVAVEFLGQISKLQVKRLKEINTPIVRYIIQIIFALSAKYAKAKYVDLMFVLMGRHALLFFELGEVATFERVYKWNKKLLKKLLNLTFKDLDFDSYNDSNAYAIEHFMKNFNSAMNDEKIAAFVFCFFKEIIIEKSKKDYNLFLRIHNLENIYKNYQEYWELALDEIKLSFSTMSKNAQARQVVSLVSGSDIAGCKLGIFLARSYDVNVSQIITNKTLFESDELYHECFLLIKHHMQRNYLNETISNKLVDIIYSSKFGLDMFFDSNKTHDEYFDNLILSKRMSLLLLFDNQKSKEAIDYLSQNGVKPHPNDEIADKCDYVHVSSWSNEIKITADLFKDISYDKWCEGFVNECEKASESISKRDCGTQFAMLVLELNAEQFDEVVKCLKTIPEAIRIGVLYQFQSNNSKIPSPKVLADNCLEMLNEMVESNAVNDELAKAIFGLLSDINVQDEDVVNRILKCIRPWLKISIDKSVAFSGDHHILTNLINSGDFDKITVLLNSFIALKKIKEYTLSDADIELLVDAMAHDNANHTVRLSLCYYYQNIRYVAPQKFKTLFDMILGNNTFDMTSLMFCVLNSSFVFSELIEKVKAYYLDKECLLPTECQDRYLPERFYSYIIAARYYNRLQANDFEKAYRDCGFIEHFLRNLSQWTSKESFVLDDWIIPCWKYIKSNYDQNTSKLVELIIHSLEYIVEPTEELLEIYLEVIDSYDDKMSVYIKPNKCLPFFKVNASKAAKLLYEIYDIVAFVNEDDLKLTIGTLKEYNLSREASSLLNMLTEKGKISNAQKEKLIGFT